jgi:hypothetical protein
MRSTISAFENRAGDGVLKKFDICTAGFNFPDKVREAAKNIFL